MEVFFLMLLISITYLLGLYLSFQKGKKYQFENDKKMLDKLKNNELFGTSKRKGGGIGLGYAAAFKSAKENNGSLTIESSDKQGTIQRLGLPLAK